MIRHMRHGSPPRLMALQLILSPNRRESLPTGSAGVRITSRHFGGPVAKFCVHGSLGLSADVAASGSEAAHDPECDCREAEASLQGRFQGPALRGSADPACG